MNIMEKGREAFRGDLGVWALGLLIVLLPGDEKYACW